MGFNIQAAKQAGYSDQEIQDYLKSQQNTGQQTNSQTQTPPLHTVGNILSTLGLGAIKNIGADAFDIGKYLFGGGQKAFANGYNNPLRNEQELTQTRNQQNLGGFAGQEGKDIAGLASWAIPGKLATSIPGVGGLISKAPGIVSAGVNSAAQGGLQGGLSAVSQPNANPQSVVQGAATGAVLNPTMSAAGHLLTDTLPRYIGIRNYGVAGAKLPEVVKAENAAGGQTLKDVRDEILTNTGGASQDRSKLIGTIKDLASQPEWVGTKGLSELTKKSGKAIPTETGMVRDISNAIQNATDGFDAYNRVKNLAYPDTNTPASGKLAAFARAAAHQLRENLIDTSDNPTATRNAMDIYAAQTAMKSAKGGIGGSKITNMLAQIGIGGGGEMGLAGLTAMIPHLGGLTPVLAADAALTNSVTGPALARGLVSAGSSKNGQVVGEFLKRLGIGGAQGISNLGASQ